MATIAMMNEHQKNPIRVQRRREKGYKMPENTIYVGRGSRWCSPFRVMQYSDKKWAIKTDGSDKCGDILVTYCHAVYDTKEGALIDAVKCYKYWLMFYTNKEVTFIDDAKRYLKGKNLACWCNLGEKCHADVLMNIVNS